MVEASFLSFVFILSIFFFRKEPRVPPSAAAVAPREESTCKSLKLLMCNANFMLLALSFLCSNGSLNGITSVIEEVFDLYSYSNPESYTSLVCCLIFLIGFIGSLLFAVVADKTKKLKLLLVLTNLFATISAAAFTWLVELENKWLSGFVCCAFGLFNISSLPITLELAA